MAVSWRTALHWSLFAAALAYLGYQLPPLVRSAGAAADRIGDIAWGWAGVAALLGLAAVAAYAELHRELLAIGGAPIPSRTVQSITFAENAIGNTVPVVGGAGGIAYAISRFHRRGADPALASWAVLLAALMTTLTLVGLAAGALGVTGRLPRAPAVLVVAGTGAVAVGLWTAATHPHVLRTVLRPFLRLSRWIPGQCAVCREGRAADQSALVDRVSTRLALLRPSRAQWAQLLAVSVLTWALDFGDLTMSSVAVLGEVPWSALVWGFVIVQGSIALQVVPGGAGLAEVGLLGALLASGASVGPATLTVLLFRANSWLLPSLLGWVAYGVHIHVTRPRPHLHHPAPAVAGG
jgi:putative heme transporter